MTVTYPAARDGIQYTEANSQQLLRQIVETLNRMNKGQMNVALFVTLDAGQATTTVIDPRISAQTCASFCPTTANAAAQLAALYVTCTNGQMVVHHTNNAQIDRNYTVGLFG